MTKKTVLVTGCSSGLGLALVKAFCERGYRVAATARNPAAIDYSHPRLTTAALDVTDTAALDGAVARLREQLGRIDILVNNAGYGLMGPLVETPIERLRDQFETNTFAPLALVQAVLPAMRAQGSGTIVNIGSVSGRLVTPFAGGYCASKAALEALDHALRRELKPFNIRVQYIMAGGIRSHFGARASGDLEGTLRSDSMYRGLQDRIRERAGLSQKNGTPAEEVALRIIDALEHTPDKPCIRVGAGANSLYRLSRLPARLQDFLLNRRFGLSRFRPE